MSRTTSAETPSRVSRWRQDYDDLGRLSSRCYDYSLGLTRCYTARYDAVGNPVEMTDPDGKDIIEYDALDRVKKVTREVAGVTVSVEDYAYNALGALKVNAGVVLDDQRPRLDGNGMADAAVPATFGGQPVVLDGGGRVTSLEGTTFTYSSTPWILRKVTPPAPALPIRFGQDPDLRRIAEVRGTTQAEFYYYNGHTTSFVQPLKWKARWRQSFGGSELYDIRTRQWSPELGVFLSIDAYEYHDRKTTLWAWPGQNPESRDKCENPPPPAPPTDPCAPPRSCPASCAP